VAIEIAPSFEELNFSKANQRFEGLKAERLLRTKEGQDGSGLYLS
jgi:hypothetical protein